MTGNQEGFKSHYEVQVDLELTSSLPQLPRAWENTGMYVLTVPIKCILEFNPHFWP